MQLSPTNVHSASTPAQKLLILRFTCGSKTAGNLRSHMLTWHSLEKSVSVAHNVTSPANILPALRHTFGPIQEWNHSSVTSATILALILLIWNDTSALTPEKSPTTAINAVSQASNLVTFRGTCWRSTERNQMCEKKNVLQFFCCFILKSYLLSSCSPHLYHFL